MEMTAASGFMNKRGHKRAAAVTRMDSPFSSFLPCTCGKQWGEHSKASVKQLLHTSNFIEAPSEVVYSLSYKISTLTTAPPIAGATPTHGWTAVWGLQLRPVDGLHSPENGWKLQD